MNISTSIRKLTQLFVILFIALSGGLVYWQVVVADQVTSNPHNGRPCLPDNAPVRGRILDKNGVVLAESTPDPHAPCGYRRHYTDSSLAGLIGYYAPGYQSTGIEHTYDDYLSGRVGMTVLDNTINKTLHHPPIGDDIYLTIDDRIQKIADHHFDDPIVTDNSTAFPTNRGSVVVSDPHSGALLALVSRPGFDPNRMVDTLGKNDLSYYNELNSDNIGRPLRERPLQDSYLPGSIYKTVTLMAGLDTGSTTLDTSFDQDQALGPLVYNGQRIGPEGNNLSFVGQVPGGYTLHFPVSTNYGYTHSDNMIYAQVGVKTGSDKWMDYNKRFYIGQKLPFDLPTTPSTVLKDGQPLNDYDLANNAFGQGFDQITPLQMSLFDNAISNNGNLMRPLVLLKITDHDKNPIRTFDPTSLGNPITSDTATKVREAMYGVTFCGSGLVPRVMINSSPWGILSKTGTAQVSDNKTIPAHSWLFTAAPYTVNNPSQLPALTIIGMKENGGEGGKQNGPMISAIYNDVFTKIDTFSSLKAPGAADTATYCCKTKLLQRGC